MAWVRIVPNQRTALDTEISDELGQKILRMVTDEILGKAEGPQVGAHLSSCPIYDGQGGECNCLAEKLEAKPTVAQPSPGAATDQDLKERPAQPSTEAEVIKQLEKPSTQPSQVEKEKPAEATNTERKGMYPAEIKDRAVQLLAEGKRPGEVHEIIEKEFKIPVKISAVYSWQKDRNADTKKKPAPASGEGAGKVEPKKKPEKDKYAGFKIMAARDNDLLIIEELVMCPKAGKAVDVDDCRSGCGEYISIIRHTKTKEPHVRCAAA